MDGSKRRCIIKLLGQLEPNKVANALEAIKPYGFFNEGLNDFGKISCTEKLMQLEAYKIEKILEWVNAYGFFDGTNYDDKQNMILTFARWDIDKTTKVLKLLENYEIFAKDFAKEAKAWGKINIIRSLEKLEISKCTEVLEVMKTYADLIENLDGWGKASIIEALGKLETSKIMDVMELIQTYGLFTGVQCNEHFKIIQALGQLETGKIKGVFKEIIEAMKVLERNFEGMGAHDQGLIIVAFNELRSGNIIKTAQIIKEHKLITEKTGVLGLERFIVELRKVEPRKLTTVLDCIKTYGLFDTIKESGSERGDIIRELSALETDQMIAISKIIKNRGFLKYDYLSHIIKDIGQLESSKVIEAFDAINTFKLVTDKEIERYGISRMIWSLAQIESGRISEYITAVLEVCQNCDLFPKEMEGRIKLWLIGSLGKFDISKIKEIITDALTTIKTYELFNEEMDDSDKATIIIKICNNLEKKEALELTKTYNLFTQKMSAGHKCNMIEFAIKISENQKMLEAIKTYNLFPMNTNNEENIWRQAKLISELFGENGICQLDDPIRTHFFLTHLLEWQREFFFGVNGH